MISTPRAERAAFNAAIVAGAPLRMSDQERWMNDDLRLPELFHYLLDESDAYRALVFAPYLFWPAFACGQIAPDRTILMPCLHDEPEARLDIFQPLFSGSRGIWFLSDPERDLAASIHPRLAESEVIGSGHRRARPPTTPRASGAGTASRARSSSTPAGARAARTGTRMLAAFAPGGRERPTCRCRSSRWATAWWTRRRRSPTGSSTSGT